MRGTFYISKLKNKIWPWTLQFRFLGVVTTYLSLPYTSPLEHKSLLLMNFWEHHLNKHLLLNWKKSI